MGVASRTKSYSCARMLNVKYIKWETVAEVEHLG